MHVGTQIIAPEGWASLPAKVMYHFLANDAAQKRVLLVLFCTDAGLSNARADLIVMQRSDFEDGAQRDKIIPLDEQKSLPAWLEKWEGIDLSQIDLYRPASAKISHQERVEMRFLHIAPAVRDFKEILAAPEPQAEINRRASLCNPPQNQTRYRLWLCTYLCFGHDLWTLLPPFHLIGHWDRFQYPHVKFGAPSIAYGRTYGNGCSAKLAAQCVESYIKRAKRRKHMTQIYEAAMMEDFHCKVITLASGMKVYSHPTGAPFPTYWQFRYRVLLAIGVNTVQKTLYGEVRHRTRIAASKGRFTEEVTNLLERIEADGRYIKERPRGYLEGSTLPGMCVVESRDVLSGKKLGIGFAFGKERSSAYRMMLFSMAVPKDFFCMLFGVTLHPGEWMNEGLPPHFSVDRGPGARKSLIEEFEKQFPIRDLAPSWSGQSKATVESGHTRELKMEGEPDFVQSNLTPVQLARKEIIRLIRFNNTSDAEDRLDPDSDLAGVPPTPIGLWQYYDKLFRNDGHPIRIDEAVRTFLTPIEFSVREDGVYLGARRFYTDELRATGILDGRGNGCDGTKIGGYLLDMCIRYAWVEVNGKLLLVAGKLRMRGDEETLYMSLADLAQWTEARRVIGSAAKVHAHAASSEYANRFESDTGRAWDSGKPRKGKPKKNATSVQEASEARGLASGKDAA